MSMEKLTEYQRGCIDGYEIGKDETNEKLNLFVERLQEIFPSPMDQVLIEKARFETFLETKKPG